MFICNKNCSNERDEQSLTLYPYTQKMSVCEILDMLNTVGGSPGDELDVCYPLECPSVWMKAWPANNFYYVRFVFLYGAAAELWETGK